MKIQQLLEHHGIARNPFAQEDAQTDPVFKDHCIDTTYHPAWDKVYGDPAEPSTAVVFGEKGAGKTALRLQIAKHLREYNEQHPQRRLLILHYDDFNPFLDRFRDRVGPRRKRADKVLAEWRLWDHMDAILGIGVTGLIDRLVGVRHPSPAIECDVHPDDAQKLDQHQARDLLLLAAVYDQSTSETFSSRWRRLKHALRFWSLRANWDLILGSVWSLLVIGVVIGLYARGYGNNLGPLWIYLILIVAGWLPWIWRFIKCHFLARRIVRHVRVGNRERSSLRQKLLGFSRSQLASQPLPSKDSTDDRYEMLVKFQSIFDSLGYTGMIVLVDRVDEPHLINGSAELMKALVWPILDNKFLKHPGIGIKLMLPIELTRFIDREERDFYQRARLDKQNMIRSFEWTGEALMDVTNARIQACAVEGQLPTLRELIKPEVSDQRVVDVLRSMRTPRHLFKFLYRLLVDHCNAHSDQSPVWQVSSELFEATYAVSQKDQDAFDRGIGAG